MNISLEAVTLAITNSFNKLSTEGVKVRNLPSVGGNTVPLSEVSSFDAHGLVFIFFLKYVLIYSIFKISMFVVFGRRRALPTSFVHGSGMQTADVRDGLPR